MAKVWLSDRILTAKVSLGASVMLSEGLWQKFSSEIEFEVTTGDDYEDLRNQARSKVEEDIQHEVDEAFAQVKEIRGRK